MKYLYITLGVLLGFLLAFPTKAQSPTYAQPLEFISDIYQSEEQPIEHPTVPVLPLPGRTQPSGRDNIKTSTRNTSPVSAEAIKQILTANSPLYDYADLIAQSNHSATIIGICWIEQYHCQRAPQRTNNYWGIGGAQGLKSYQSPEAAIQGITELLAEYEVRGYDTVEELNGYYVQPASPSWYNTVIKIKHDVEQLD